MAEFPRQIRQVGGGMESHRSPLGPRRLLPAEADLCNALGIKESDYWEFVDLIQLHRPTRPSEYDRVPNIVNDPVSLTGFTWTQLAVNLAIGVAISYVAYLLTPKPRQQTPGTNLRTEDKYGSRAYAPQQGFNTVQELATLGAIIPLIYTKQEGSGEYTTGGVRVNAQLLWSQLISLGRSQQLKALALFSHGQIALKPEFAGYAIGDLLIENYNKSKVALYFREGTAVNDNRITTGDKYGEGTLPESPFSDIGGQTDPFSVEFPVNLGGEPSKKAFSGTTNPTTQAIFGLYSPMPNGSQYKLPFEFIMELRGMTQSTILDTYKKMRKIDACWPTRAALIEVAGQRGRQINRSVSVGQELLYEIFASGNQAEQENSADYDPWKVEDVKSAVQTIRETADQNLALGESYMVGTAIVRLFRIASNPNSPGKTWEVGITKTYYFKVVEAGVLDVIDMPGHLANPVWGGAQKTTSEGNIYIDQQRNNLSTPYDTYMLQRLAIATVSNTRECDVTEIGIKSKVNKSISFQNVNSQPDAETIQKYWSDRASISLGNIQRTISRFSFFKLQARVAGSDNNWINLSNSTNNHSGLFCIIGNTPQEQYNYLTIKHPSRDQYEFRLLPWPGNDVAKNCVGDSASTSKAVNVLNASYSEDNDAVQQFTSNSFTVRFVGRDDLVLTKERVSNPDWVQNLALSLDLADQDGPVTSLSRTSTAGPGQAFIWPTTSDWVYEQTHYNYPVPSVGKPIWVVSKVIWGGATNWIFYLHSIHRGAGLGPLSNGVVANEDPTQAWFEFNGKKYRPGTQQTTTHPEDPSIPQDLWSVLEYEEIDTPVSHDFAGNVSLTNGSGSGLQVYLETASSATSNVAKWTITNNGDGYKNGETVTIPAKSGSPYSFPATEVQVTIERNTDGTGSGSTVINNLNPFDKIADFPQYYDGDISSHQSGPEHEICYVNQILEPTNTGPATYNNLAFAGIRINSSKEWTNFSQLSAYFTQGIKVESLIDGGKGATNLFPEIAYNLLTDPNIGAGDLIGVTAVDKTSMERAAKFCRANGFKWDGMISNSLNLREFIFEMAGYAFLDFTIIGGRFSLVPSVPYHGTLDNPGTIDGGAKPEIRALFSDGNISDLKVSFLTPEERQVFKAVVLYRKETKNGFPETRSISIRLNDTASENAPVEKFDLSGFCSSKDHATMFAQYALKTRKLVDHGLTFKTSPQNCVGLMPGQYFRLVSEATHTSRFQNGAITDTGEIISRDTLSGSQSIYYWLPGTTEVKEGTLNTSNVDHALRGSLFTIRNNTTENRVYKVESIAYTEEGLVEIAGSFVPLTSTGSLAVLEWYGLTDQFVISDN